MRRRRIKQRQSVKHDFYKRFGIPIADKYSDHLVFKAFKTKSKQLNLITQIMMELNIMVYIVHVSQKRIDK